MKRLITALAMAMAIFMVPVSGVMAADTIYEGKVNATVTDPIVISVIRYNGNYDSTTHQWAVSVASGSTAELVLRATNKSKTVYGVHATATATEPQINGVTAKWNVEGKTLSPDESFDFVLTVTAGQNAPPNKAANFTFQFTR